MTMDDIENIINLIKQPDSGVQIMKDFKLYEFMRKNYAPDEAIGQLAKTIMFIASSQADNSADFDLIILRVVQGITEMKNKLDSFDAAVKKHVGKTMWEIKDEHTKGDG